VAGLAALGRLNVARPLRSCCVLRAFPNDRIEGVVMAPQGAFAFLGWRRMKKSRSSRVLWV